MWSRALAQEMGLSASAHMIPGSRKSLHRTKLLWQAARLHVGDSAECTVYSKGTATGDGALGSARVC